MNETELHALANQIRIVTRALDGLTPEDLQTIFKLINVKDIREKTRIQPEQILAHTYCRLLAKYGGYEYNIFDSLAEELDHYNISSEGKNWDYATLMERAKSESVNPMQTVTVGSIPQIEGLKENREKQEKKHFWSKKEKQ